MKHRMLSVLAIPRRRVAPTRSWTAVIGALLYLGGSAAVLRGQSAIWLPQNAAAGSIYYNGGNVGIGTQSPGGKLQVSGGRSVFTANSEPYAAAVGYDAAQYATDAFFLGVTTNGGVPYAGKFQLSNAGGTPLFNVAFSGNVGIGTTNPQHLLSVNGTIGTKEVVVTNTGWSDYVFRPNYRLQPLSEVKSYIQANHHLPDIPSESEVKEKGVSLGDMQSKLLAKIEELTLHMIQAEERNSRLEQQNQALCERIARLESSAAPVKASAR